MFSDTLFTAGCGRFFEGTPEEMDHSLNKVLANLPKDTTVYNGHEYTGGNVKFALKVDPHNEFVLKLAKFVQDHSTTVGEFTIGDELNHNPFMRLSDPQIKLVNLTMIICFVNTLLGKPQVKSPQMKLWEY